MRGESLALVHLCQHLVVTRLGADVGHAETGGGEFLEFVDRFPAQVARQAVAGDAAHRRQMFADRAKNFQQAPGRQHQRIAVGEKHATDVAAETFAAAAQGLQSLFGIAGAKFLLRRGVHLAEGAPVPRTAVGHRQDQRFRLAGRAEDGIDIADREGTGHIADYVTGVMPGTVSPRGICHGRLFRASHPLLAGNRRAGTDQGGRRTAPGRSLTPSGYGAQRSGSPWPAGYAATGLRPRCLPDPAQGAGAHDATGEPRGALRQSCQRSASAGMARSRVSFSLISVMTAAAAFSPSSTARWRPAKSVAGSSAVTGRITMSASVFS